MVGSPKKCGHEKILAMLVRWGYGDYDLCGGRRFEKTLSLSSELFPGCDVCLKVQYFLKQIVALFRLCRSSNEFTSDAGCGPHHRGTGEEREKNPDLSAVFADSPV